MKWPLWMIWLSRPSDLFKVNPRWGSSASESSSCSCLIFITGLCCRISLMAMANWLSFSSAKPRSLHRTFQSLSKLLHITDIWGIFRGDSTHFLYRVYYLPSVLNLSNFPVWLHGVDSSTTAPPTSTASWTEKLSWLRHCGSHRDWTKPLQHPLKQQDEIQPKQGHL